MTVKRSTLVIPVLVLIVTLASMSASQARHRHPVGPHAAENTPVGWVSEVTNPYFPLRPGTTFHYEGTSEGVSTFDDTAVTRETKVILGVICTVVQDDAHEGGILVESTLDWYAQDLNGNVWYFGEYSKRLDPQGNVISTEGSWEAGVNGAQQGIIMEAHPRVGDKYNQEFSSGVAEDKAQVLSVNKATCVIHGCYDDLLLTKEWSPLEKNVTEHKYYAPGVGFIRIEMVKGGEERSELVRISTDGNP